MGYKHTNSKGKSYFLHSKDVDCLLYTSDAADEQRGVDLGGRRIIKKKKIKKKKKQKKKQQRKIHLIQDPL